MLTPETPIEILKDILPVGSIQVWGIKVLSPKQLQQRLSLLFAQVKVDDISVKLLNEIRQIVYSFSWEKQMSKKAYNDLLKSMLSKTPDVHRLTLNLTD